VNVGFDHLEHDSEVGAGGGIDLLLDHLDDRLQNVVLIMQDVS
jgi:hypothetical protein